MGLGEGAIADSTGVATATARVGDGDAPGGATAGRVAAAIPAMRMKPSAIAAMASPAKTRVSLLRCVLATPVVIVPSIEVVKGGALGSQFYDRPAWRRFEPWDAEGSGHAAGRRTISR